MKTLRLLGVSAFPTAVAHVYAKRGVRTLARIASVLGLQKKAALGRLFGVSRQAIDDWYARGVPLDRLADVGRVADMAEALHARFLPERIPQIVRQRVPGLGDRSVLEAVRERGPVPVLDLLDRTFSYTPQ